MDIELADDPIDVVRRIFQKAIDQALIETIKNLGTPDKIGVTIYSEALDFPLWIPINKITENTVDSLFNRFEEVYHSFIYT
jgi:hypothetical protein